MRSWRISLAAFAVPAIAAVTAIAAPRAAQAQVYGLLINQNSGKCLDVYNWSKQPGAVIDQWTCGNSQANQSWTNFPQTGGDDFVNENSQLCLLSDGVAGDDVTQAACNGSRAETWVISVYNNHTAIKNLGSGLYLDVYGASKNNGATVDTWYFNGNNNQLWHFG